MLKNEKYLSLLILFFIFIISMGIVSASSNETALETSDMSSNVSSTAYVNGGTFDDVQDVINNASDGDVIELNGTFKGNSKSIDVSKSLTIKGTGNTVLDAENRSGIFIFTGENITFIDLTFTNSNSSAIYCPYIEEAISPNISIINCNFINNHANSGTGADIDNWNVLINHGNTGTGAAINIESADKVSISNSSFMNNNAKVAGAIFSNCIEFIINNSNLYANYADTSGALICRSLHGRITNCNFKNNHAKSGSGAMGVYASNYANPDTNYHYIDNCNFTNNFAVSNGVGAININSNCLINNSKFINNQVTKIGHAGAIYSEQIYDNFILTVMNCDFNGNSAGPETGTDRNHGGAINTDGRYKIMNCNFTNNRAGTVGGAIYALSGESIIKDCIFKSNHAVAGGAIYGAGIVQNCEFTNNIASWYGGAIQDATKLINSRFTGNSAKYGGAIYTGTISIVNCKFIKNRADYGSAIGFFSALYERKLTISNSAFSGNVAKGGISLQGHPFKIYLNGAITDDGGKAIVKITKCTGAVRNSNAFKFKTTIYSPNIVMKHKQNKYLVITVKGVLGRWTSLLKGYKIAIKINGKMFIRTTNNNGQVKLPLKNLLPNRYKVMISYSGDNFNTKAQRTSTIIVR